MEIIANENFDHERALYGRNNAFLENCSFSGEADGESAVKECSRITAKGCFFDLRYPLWHCNGLKIQQCEMTENCRAALWYSREIEIADTAMHGCKALRECQGAHIQGCDIRSDEFGWFCRGVRLEECKMESEYCMLHSSGLRVSSLRFQGKYSFQYLEDCLFEDCRITSRDAFWHAKGVTVRNSLLAGEFLGWYSDGLTLENCRIISSQALCYCKNLTLVDCELVDSDLCFEKSGVQATLTAPCDSIKNPASGRIVVPHVDEIIRDDPASKAEIIVGDAKGGALTA